MSKITLCAINNRKHFDFINKHSIKFVGKLFICIWAIGYDNSNYLSSNNHCLYLCIKASRKFGIAVVRNRFKRQFRSIIRQNITLPDRLLKQKISTIIIPRSLAIRCSYADLASDWIVACSFVQRRLKVL